MSSARYTPAPTSDPDDYPNAPPAYSPTTPAGVYGAAPRTEDDNLPDDFKFGGCVAEATLPIRNQFIRKVYTILTIQLVLTAALSSLTFLTPAYKTFIQSHPFLMYLSLFSSIALLFATHIYRQTYPTNLILLTAFTLTEAYSISVVVSFYSLPLILHATFLTGGLFLFLTLFACQTKYDFTSWIPYVSGALWGLVLFGFMYMFLPATSTTELVYGGLSALIFSVYILIDTQMIMYKFHVDEEISAALELYLDIINLFLAILRILNSTNDD